jgi:uncharacterized protein (TIGR02452 family)
MLIYFDMDSKFTFQKKLRVYMSSSIQSVSNVGFASKVYSFSVSSVTKLTTIISSVVSSTFFCLKSVFQSLFNQMGTENIKTFLPEKESASIIGFLRSKQTTYLERKKALTDLFQSTKRACQNGFDIFGRICHLDDKLIDMMKKGTIVLDEDLISKTLDETGYPFPVTDSLVKVVSSDTVECALRLKQQGYNPAVLNFANENYPGGFVEGGSSAQEESLFRRSCYHLSLYPSQNTCLKAQLRDGKYKIPEFGCIYSPNVQFFRTTEGSGCHFKRPICLDMIACAAYDLARETRPTDYQNKTKRKIRSILRAALINRNDSIVLGAFGCGAFRNDPVEVTKLFKEVLQEEEFAVAFKNIYFAIKEGRRTDNCKPFHKELDGLKTSQSRWWTFS